MSDLPTPNVEAAQHLAELEASLATAVAARQTAEQQLHDAETRYRTLVEQIPAITYIVDVQGPIGTTIYISPRVKDILGYTPAEWLADPDLWQKLLHPVDRDYVLAEVVRQNTAGNSVRLTYRSLTRDGRVIWFQNQSVILRDEQGRPRFTHGIMLDITERKEAERALTRQQTQLEKEAKALNQDLNRARQALTVLHRVTQALTATHALPTMLQNVVQELGILFEAHYLNALVLGAARTHFTVVAEYARDPNGAEALGTQLAVADHTVASQIVDKGRSMIFPQAQTNSLTTALWPQLRARRTTCLMMAPLLARGTVIGTLSIETDDPRREFTPDELALLETIAGPIASAIENARLAAAEPPPAAD